ARARARRARHPRQHAGAGLHLERHGDARESRPRRGRARARRAVALAAARRASPGPSGGARFLVVGGERFRHRPDARGRWRQRESLIFGALKREIVSLYTNSQFWIILI